MTPRSPTSPSPPTAARSRPARRPAASGWPSTISCCGSRNCSATRPATRASAPTPAPARIDGIRPGSPDDPADRPGGAARGGDLRGRAEPRLPGARLPGPAAADRPARGAAADDARPGAEPGGTAGQAVPARLHRAAGAAGTRHVLPRDQVLHRRGRLAAVRRRRTAAARAGALVREGVAFGRAGRRGHRQVIAPRDAAVIAAQLGRAPRALLAVAHRCPCGLPDVAETAPRLADGTPFPTLYYLTCPLATAAVSRLEASGVMRLMTARLADEALRRRYRAAHRDYLAGREAAARAAGVRPLPPGGLPDRVKCVHVLAAHELAAGGMNPFGREALDAVGPWWRSGPCAGVPAGEP